jgi:hypothetical protein
VIVTNPGRPSSVKSPSILLALPRFAREEVIVIVGLAFKMFPVRTRVETGAAYWSSIVAWIARLSPPKPAKKAGERS